MADNYIYDGIGNKYLPFIRVNEVFTDENGTNQFVIVEQGNAKSASQNQISLGYDTLYINPNGTQTVPQAIYVKINGELKKVKEVYIGDSDNNPKRIITFS